MQDLLQGVQNFQSGVFPAEKQLFEDLAAGQSPETLFITCSDSRIAPNLITGTKPGELFVLRTAGNIVPPYGAVRGGEAATVEYAVAALKVKDVVVCGHSHCGAMGAVLDPPSREALPAVLDLLEHAESTRRVLAENYTQITEPGERLAAAVQVNVLEQLANLQTHPSVAAALARGDVRLHGWVYEFEAGRVLSYDAEERAFTPLADTSAAVAHSGPRLTLA